VKLWSLQILRFFAALGVVTFHAGWLTKNATGHYGLVLTVGDSIGRAGVDVFFVLSGVIIATVARGMKPGDFALKRLRRIYPIYLLMVLPWIAFGATVGTLDWRSLLSTVTLWPVTDRITPPLSPVAWTLCFEMLFYAAAALVLWRRWMLVALLALYLAALAAPVFALPQFVGSPLCLEFLAGVAISRLPRRRWMTLALPAGLCLLVALAALPIASPDAQIDAKGFHDVWIRVATLGVPAALIVWGTMQIEARPGVLSYLGDASYSLYLIHPLVLMLWAAAAGKLLPGAPADAIALAGIVLAVIAGWRIHEAIEKPVLNALRPRPAREAVATA